MALWIGKIDIADLLTEDESDAEAIRVGKEIAKRANECIVKLPSLRDDDFTDIVKCMQNHVTDVDELNYQLERLYDWGDTGNRMFINTIPGLPLMPAFYGA